MLYLPRQDLETIDDLHAALANAIALELGTIPPYLTALFSIKPGANAAAGAIIRSVVIEEMLHLSLACNMLNAVGGRPDLPAAVLRYPSELPMGIGDTPGHPFVVGLARLSEASIATFMTIEEPEHPLEFPDAPPDGAAVAADYHTIGEFYAAVGELMSSLGPAIFTGAPDRQVSGWVATNVLAPIDTLAGALAAITMIVDQGEGTTTSPADAPDELAHYYRFEQIQHHATLHPDASAPQGYEWGEPAIALADNGVWPMIDNPPCVRLPEGSDVARLSDQCDATFTALVNELQRTFDGAPQALGGALAQMHALRLEAQALVPLNVPDQDGTAGPRFLYLG
jgi:hypothetical protein